MGEIAKPHDSLFTLLIQRPESARALLCEQLPRRIVGRLGPEPFASAAGKSTNVDLRAARIDGLFRMPVIGSDVPIYCVVEHRSTVDPEVLLRLLDYQSRVLTLVASERTKELSHFPQVKVLVVYNGRQRWTLPRSFKEWVCPAGAQPGRARLRLRARRARGNCGRGAVGGARIAGRVDGPQIR